MSGTSNNTVTPPPVKPPLQSNIGPTPITTAPPLTAASSSKPLATVTAIPIGQTSRTKSKESKWLEFDPGHQTAKWTSTLSIRLLLIALWLVALSFGSTSFLVTVNDRSIFGFDVTVDAQLAFLGIFNKVMDTLLLVSLEDLTSVLVLGWMLSGAKRRVSRLLNQGSGAHIGDFELFDEVSKPWHAIGAFCSRCTNRGFSVSSLLRGILVLAVSVCVLLQGLAINTLGMPKERWYPDEAVANRAITSHPSMKLLDIDSSFWNDGWNIVGNGRYSWDAATAYSAAAAYVNLQALSLQFSYLPRTWKAIGSDSNKIVAIDTTYNGTGPARGIAVQSRVFEDVFAWLRKSGTSISKSSYGWMATVRMTLPMVMVDCSSNIFLNVSDERTVMVDQQSTNSSSFRLWTTFVSSEDLGGTAFDPVVCSIELSRTIFPITAYSKDNGTTRIGVGTVVNSDEGRAMDSDPIDTILADRIRSQLDPIASRFETLVPNLSAVQMLARNARWMRSSTIRPDITSDAAAFASTIALLCTHILAHASWSYILDESNMLHSSPVRFQIYASGPRLQWEWAAATILGFLVIIHVIAVVLSLFWRASPPDFMKPGGMLVASNLSDQLTNLESSSSGKKGIENETFYVRKVDQERVSIVQHSDRDKGDIVDIRERLKWS